jgi:hypothetical protein
MDSTELGVDKDLLGIAKPQAVLSANVGDRRLDLSRGAAGECSRGRKSLGRRRFFHGSPGRAAGVCVAPAGLWVLAVPMTQGCATLRPGLS